MVNEYEENRFAYLKEYSKEELEAKLKEATYDLNNSLEAFNSSKISSEQKNDAHNDIKYDRDLISAINEELKKRNSLKR